MMTRTVVKNGYVELFDRMRVMRKKKAKCIVAVNIVAVERRVSLLWLLFLG